MRSTQSLALLAALTTAFLSCGDLAMVELEVSTTTKTITIDVGSAVNAALSQLVSQGVIPSTDPSTWRDEISIEFTEREPLEMVPPPKLLDLEQAEKGGSEFSKYRDNVSTIVIDSLGFSIRENTLNYDLGPLTLLAGDEEDTTEQLAEIATAEDGVEAGHLSPGEGYEKVPLNQNQKKLIGSFLDLMKFKVGLKGRWSGRLDNTSLKPTGLIRVKIRVEATATASPL